MSEQIKAVIAMVDYPMCGGCGQVFGADWTIQDFAGHVEQRGHAGALLVLPNTDPGGSGRRIK